MSRSVLASLCGAMLSLPSLAMAQKPADIVDTAVAAGSFQTLTAALEAADLVDALRGDGPFTVFAPTDAAFAKLADGTVEKLLEPENRDTLRSILTYHVVPGKLTAADVLKRDAIETLNGQRAHVRLEDGTARIDDARIVKTDVVAKNGVIHVIDSVILPKSDDLVATAGGLRDFRTLWAAAKAAGIADAIRGDGPFTLLAPTDAAFAKLPEGTLPSLLEPENRAALRRILEYHVVPGRVFADQAVLAGSADTLAGEAVRFRIRDGRLVVNDSRVEKTDVQATNGVIHVIDSVLTPPARPQPRGRKVFGLFHDTPGRALAAQLGLDRHRSLVVTRITTGSKAEAAGLEPYDVLLQVAGRPATDGNLTRAKQERDYGESVEFVILRGGEEQRLHIAIGEEKH